MSIFWLLVVMLNEKQQLNSNYNNLNMYVIAANKIKVNRIIYEHNTNDLSVVL